MQKPDYTGEFFIPDNAHDKNRDEHLARYQFAQGFVKNKQVLDIACGEGYGAFMLKDTAAYVVGVDISADIIQYASEKYKSGNLIFRQGDIRTFGARENISFNVIVCYETIEHISDYFLAASNMYSLLTQGGKLIISSPNRRITSPNAKLITDAPGNRFHTQEFTPHELVKILRDNGFKISKRDIFGQRQRLVFQNKLINGFWSKYLKPDTNSSPDVKRLGWLKSPRYFVLICTKI